MDAKRYCDAKRRRFSHLSTERGRRPNTCKASVVKRAEFDNAGWGGPVAIPATRRGRYRVGGVGAAGPGASSRSGGGGAFLLEVQLDSVVEQARAAGGTGGGEPRAPMCIEAETDRARVAVSIWSLEGRETGGGWRLGRVSGCGDRAQVAMYPTGRLPFPIVCLRMPSGFPERRLPHSLTTIVMSSGRAIDAHSTFARIE